MLGIGKHIGFGSVMLVVCGGSVAQTSFLRLAEGYTSRDEQVGIVAAQRMFSVPDFPDVCASGRSLDRFVVIGPDPIRLVQGQWFSFAWLVVVAVDVEGNLLAPVPIAIDIEEATPGVLDLRSDMTADPDGRVLPVSEGQFRFRFRAICEGLSVSATLGAEVVAE